MGDGWIAFDLDGTLAVYDEWRGIDHIGEPVVSMVERVKDYLRRGHEVRIFTARVAGDDRAKARWHIEKWCEQHIGQKLPVTNEKDFGMTLLFDDRCVQVLTNTGRTVDVGVDDDPELRVGWHGHRETPDGLTPI